MPHALVTGASSGIGASLARELAAHGWDLTLVARRKPLLEELAASLDTRTHVIVADLSDTSRAAPVVEQAEAALGPVDLLIANAGVQVIGHTARVDPDWGEASLLLNLATPIRMWTAVLPGMLERKRGSIVNIASMASLAPTPGMAWYNAGKAGLSGASEALRGELRGTGVHVMTVYPGIIDTTELARKGLQAYQSSAILNLQPTGTDAELARRIRRGVERRQARLIYPWINTSARYFPTITRWLMDLFTPPLTT